MLTLLLSMIIELMHGFAFHMFSYFSLFSLISFFPFVASLTAFITSFLSLCNITSNDGLIMNDSFKSICKKVAWRDQDIVP